LYLQFSRTDCSRHHPPRGSLSIVLAVLKDRLLQTSSTKTLIVHCTCSSQGQIVPENIHQEVHCTCSSQGQIVPDNIHQ
jgi:hypothetical protein